MSPTAINSIEHLTSNNFKKWKRDLQIESYRSQYTFKIRKAIAHL